MTMIPFLRHSRNLSLCAAALLILVLASCTQRPKQGESADVYERATHRLTQAPAAAASCIARNAANAGYASVLQPLFGTAAIAVSIREGGPTGDTLATISMVPQEKGSRATVTSPREMTRERKALLDTLLAQC